MAFQNIIQVGASGSLGGPVLQSLLSSEFTVSILARSSSKSTFPTGATIIKADFDSHESLVEALCGQDVAIFTFGGGLTTESLSKVLIDAAIEAGVKRIIPNAWGPDLDNGPGSQQEFLAPRYRIRDYLNVKAAEGKITYTTVAPGLFFDWALTSGVFNLDFANNKAGIFDDGSRRVMLTTIPSVASAVLGVLRNPSQTENRLIRIHDFFVSNKEVLEVVQAVSGRTLETYAISTVELEEKGRGLMPSEQGAGLQFVAAVWGEKAIAVWEEEDESALLGLEKKDVKEVVAQVLKGMGALV